MSEAIKSVVDGIKNFGEHLLPDADCGNLDGRYVAEICRGYLEYEEIWEAEHKTKNPVENQRDGN